MGPRRGGSDWVGGLPIREGVWVVHLRNLPMRRDCLCRRLDALTPTHVRRLRLLAPSSLRPPVPHTHSKHQLKLTGKKDELLDRVTTHMQQQ